MAGEAIRVEGLRALRSELRKIDQDLPKEIRDINIEAAADVVQAARHLVPRRSGNLLGSLKATATQRSGVAKAGSARVPYAGPIHFGWPRHGIRPQPFLWDALDQKRSTIVDQYSINIQALLDRTFPDGTGGD